MDYSEITEKELERDWEEFGDLFPKKSNHMPYEKSKSSLKVSDITETSEFLKRLDQYFYNYCYGNNYCYG